MTIERVRPGPRMSQAVVHAGIVYLSGQVAATSATTEGQTREILATIDQLLQQTGSSKSQLLSATIWLTDIGDFAAMNAVWEQWIDPANPPTRATVEARLAQPQFKVEIAVVAAVNG